MTVLPRRLEKGDTIGIVSPASPFPAWFPRRFARSVFNLESKGYKVKLAPNVRKVLGHKAGSREDRLADIHSMYRDDSVRLIMTSLGGYNSNELLDDLDYDLIRENPKGLVGYSDVTALHLAIHSKTQLASFYGPHLMFQFGEYPNVLEYTFENFERVVCQARPAGRIRESKAWTEERLEFEKEDDRPRRMQPAGWKMLRPGKASGSLVGGEITTLVIQTGTDYMPPVDGSIFFWEAYDGCTLAWVDRFLADLRTKGIYERIKGMLVGRTKTVGFEPSKTGHGLNEVILEHTRGHDFPIITNMDFGHTDPIMTLPIGVQATMDAEDNHLSIDEPAVTA